MARIALLIGASEYGTGIPWLPCATKDVTALQHLLEDKEIGKFDEVRTLLNPDTQTMAKAIEKLFREREKEDFVLLFFSGHGIQDDSGRLFFAAHNTQEMDGKIYWADTVSASFVHDQIEGSRCWQIVVILNCCFSGAFSSNLVPRSVGIADVKAQLGGKGQAILTSCNAVQFSFEEKDAALSIYSQHLVEGIKTGEADQDGDGRITVDELHNYIRKNVKDSGFPMNPEIHLVMEEPLTIAHTLVQDKGKFYENKVALFAQQGKISKTCHKVLVELRGDLALSREEAKAIESKVLKPQRKYQKSLHLYRQEFLTIAQRSPGVSERDRNLLVRLHQGLRLNPEDVEQIEAEFLQKMSASNKRINRLMWALLHSIGTVSIMSAATIGIYFRLYNNLPQPILEPLSPTLEELHENLFGKVDDLRHQLAMQIMDSQTVALLTAVQTSSTQTVVEKVMAAAALTEKAQTQVEWSSAAEYWKQAIDEWHKASQIPETELQKAKSELCFGEAVSNATTAAEQSHQAKTQAEWQAIAHLWEQAHDYMQAVSPVSHHKQLAKARSATYAANQQEAQKRAKSLSQSAVNK
ncbi:MAG: caspase family protein [Timaviella obliquedivisa GSE-PSE-MK23-08B]|jgi:hypothetical protein|nr:caspase family protein [Timaviella obliquedivisa GSE-PSE-MK23-08B]